MNNGRRPNQYHSSASYRSDNGRRPQAGGRRPADPRMAQGYYNAPMRDTRGNPRRHGEYYDPRYVRDNRGGYSPGYQYGNGNFRSQSYDRSPYYGQDYGRQSSRDPRANSYGTSNGRSGGTGGGYYNNQFYGNSGYYGNGRTQGGMHNGSYSSGYGNGYRDPRAEAYIRQRREAQLRAERARRMEYERRRAAAREARRRLEEQIKKEKKLRRQRLRKIFFGRAVICLIIFAILAVMTGVCLTLHFNSSPDSPPARTTYTYGGTKGRTVAEDIAYRDGSPYVCFNDVADYLKLSVTGDTSSMKFVFANEGDIEAGSEGSGREDNVTFYNDSRTVLIGGQKMTLPANTFFFGEDVWVSCDFIEHYVEGLSINVSGKTIAVARIEDKESSTDDEIAFLPVSLKLKDSSPHPDIDLEEDEDDRAPVITLPDEIEFLTDLTEYEQYMSPEAPEEYLILVNSSSPADSSLVPGDLTAVADTRADGRDAQQLRLCAAKALEALFIEMREAGFSDVSVMSGYRDYWTQDYLHNYYIEEEMAADPTLSWEAAKAIVLTYSSEAGTSEHQTGLCVDMHNLESADVSFADTEAFKWLRENAWKFGYILRYPENGTASTGISFEPWHWRFVGREAAYSITSAGITLEEYLSGEGE